MSTNIELSFPVEVDGTTLTTISLKRPVVSDFINSQASSTNAAEMELNLISNLSGHPLDVLQRLDMKDYAVVQRTLAQIIA